MDLLNSTELRLLNPKTVQTVFPRQLCGQNLSDRWQLERRVLPAEDEIQNSSMVLVADLTENSKEFKQQHLVSAIWLCALVGGWCSVQLCTAEALVEASRAGEGSAAQFPTDALRQPPSQPDSRGVVVGIQGPKPGGCP